MVRTRNYNSKQVTSVDTLEIKNSKIRFLLSIKTKSQNNKSILVIMKNPSKANKHYSDKTINNVISYLNTKYSTIFIVNLFPYYSTKAKGLLSYFNNQSNKSVLFINQIIIQKYTALVDDILIGWGTNTVGMKQTDYDNIIYSMMTLLTNSNKPIYYVHCCKCSIASCKHNQPQCTDRCAKKCNRQSRNMQISCPLIRYPMHLELWNNNKTMQLY